MLIVLDIETLEVALDTPDSNPTAPDAKRGEIAGQNRLCESGGRPKMAQGQRAGLFPQLQPCSALCGSPPWAGYSCNNDDSLGRGSGPPETLQATLKSS